MDPVQGEPQGLPQYMRDQRRPRHMLRNVLILAFVILIGGGVWGLVRYGAISNQMRSDEQIAAMIAAQRVRFAEAFADTGITAAAIASGFWYTYVDAEGNEHVFYFDPNAVALQNLTDAELQQLSDVISKSHITARSDIRVLANEELPSDLQFHNAVYSFGTSGMTTLDMKGALEEKRRVGTATSDDLFRLSYLYELEGNYPERDRLDAENCERFQVRCDDDTALAITGRVVDNRGTPIAGARVEITSRPDIAPVTTNADGLYTLRSGAKRLEKLRIHASKRNFSDGYADAILVSEGVQALAVEEISLESPLSVVTLDYAAGEVTGSGNRINPDGSVVITTPQSRYEIPKGAIVAADGTSYTSGPIDVYLYEFTKGNPPVSLMSVDTFDQVMGYAGDLMKTFGMPYIQFFTQSGTELHVLRSKPMILTYTIADMDALRANTDQIYEPLTDADMALLVEASRGNPYAVDREFLINNQLLRFPAFWVFDRKRGVWDNVGVSVLDVAGTIRTIFYTIRDAY